MEIVDSPNAFNLILNDLSDEKSTSTLTDIFIITSNKNIQKRATDIKEWSGHNIQFIGGVSPSSLAKTYHTHDKDKMEGFLKNRRDGSTLVCIIDDFDYQTKHPTSQTMKSVKRFKEDLPETTSTLGLMAKSDKNKTQLIIKAMMLSRDCDINSYTGFLNHYVKPELLDMRNKAHKYGNYREIHRSNRLIDEGINAHYEVNTNVYDNHALFHKDKDITDFVSNHITNL